MPQLESLYTVEFGDIASPTYRNGGVAVLETGRVFGGDSGYYYVGTFSVREKTITADMKIVKHNPAWGTAFGDAALSFNATVEGKIDDKGTIQGHMARKDIPGIKLPVRLTWRENLP